MDIISSDFCPVTGLPVVSNSQWNYKGLNNNATSNFYIIGDSIIYSKSVQTNAIEGIKESLAINNAVAEQVSGGTGPYIQIVDYGQIDEKNLSDRKHFNTNLNSNKRCKSIIICNLSTSNLTDLNSEKRLNTESKKIHFTTNYSEAIKLALELCKKLNFNVGNYILGNEATYDSSNLSLAPVHCFSKNKWIIGSKTYTNTYLVIDNCILFSSVKGLLEEKIVPEITRFRIDVVKSLPDNRKLDYIIIDASSLKGGSRKARQLYIESINEFHKEYPFRMYIVFGVNSFMKAVATLAKPLRSFKLKIARNIDDAFNIVKNDRENKMEIIDTENKNPGPIENNVDLLLEYIGGIDWRKEGIGSDPKIDETNPFNVIFQAIKLVKEELDALRKEKQSKEIKLKQAVMNYRELFEKGSDWLTFHDLDGNLIKTNLEFKKSFGDTKSDTKQLNLKDLIPESDWDNYYEYLERIKKNGFDNGVFKLVSNTGAVTILEYNNILMYDADGNPEMVKGVGKDITNQVKSEKEKRKLNEQLRQAQKLEAIGTLAGGVAHDFNNILFIIIGNIEMALDLIQKSNPAYNKLEVVKSASLRAAGVVDQLLNFSRNPDQKLKSIEVLSIIKDTLKFLRSTIPTTIDLQKHLPDNEIHILADRVQLNQIMMNLCINASQEMEKTGGIIKVIVKKTIIDENNMKKYPNLAVGKYVQITISDTGHGIDSKVIDRIFDPYFTTKEVGKGSGMGLAVVHGIVNNFEGSITVNSKLGKGTKFKILFPIIENNPENKTKDENKLVQGTGKILFIDDEVEITEICQQILVRLGYEVETSSNPVEALNLFKSKPALFDLVITDMTMPQMTGAQLSEKLLDVRSDIPIILCTGYSSLISETTTKQIGIAAYITKPISISKISKAIRKALDK